MGRSGPPDRAELTVEARAVGLRYGARAALQDLDLAVAPGDRVGILGRNGAGKSSLLRLLATGRRPTSGMLTLLGHDARRPTAALRRRIGWAGDEPVHVDALSGRENATLFARAAGLGDAAPRVDELLRRFQLADDADRPVTEYSFGMRRKLLLVEALLLFATLMAFMGGRIIAPAMAGYAQSEGRRLDARVQPGLEGAVLILLGLAFVLNPLPWPLLRQLAAALVISAGVLSAIRLLRWQPWRCARADLLILLLGYAWLAFGLLLLGLGLLLPALSLSATLHALSVGALGSLTFAVMARTRLLYRFRDPAARPWIQAMALLISLAALARVVPALLALPQPGWLLIAAGCWSLAFLSLALLLWQCRAAHVDSPRAQPDR